MPTPRKVNGNSKGEGGFKSPIVLNESTVTLKWNFWRGGVFQLKNLAWEGYGYFLEQHNNFKNINFNNKLLHSSSRQLSTPWHLLSNYLLIDDYHASKFWP